MGLDGPTGTPWDTAADDPQAEARVAAAVAEMEAVSAADAETKAETPAGEDAAPATEAPPPQGFTFEWLTVGAADGRPTFSGVFPTPLQLFALGAYLQDLATGMLEQNRMLAMQQAMAQQQGVQDVARGLMHERRNGR